MPVQPIYADIPDNPQLVFVGRCKVQRNDWNEPSAYVEPLKCLFPINGGVIRLTQDQFNKVKGTV